MTKTVLDIGNCDPDHRTLERVLTSNYDVVVLRSHQLSDALEILSDQKVDVIMINRKLDIDYSDGVEILRHLKKDASFKDIPIMVISNDSEQQLAAVADGAEYGFGKMQYGDPVTHQRLSRFLEKKTA